MDGVRVAVGSAGWYNRRCSMTPDPGPQAATIVPRDRGVGSSICWNGVTACFVVVLNGVKVSFPCNVKKLSLLKLDQRYIQPVRRPYDFLPDTNFDKSLRFR